MWRWVRKRDPQLVVVRRAVRITLVACLGFYFCRYVLGSAAMAPYALFGVVALGALSQIPGSPRQRARTLIAVLPVGWVLVTLGTLLSVDTWAAAAGMFVLGFAVSFVGVGGPRLVGLAAGMQLLYILPCFPPYDPGSLPERLAGLTLAVVLLAVAELVIWPDPTPPLYRHRLADAVSALAACLDALADHWSGAVPSGPPAAPTPDGLAAPTPGGLAAPTPSGPAGEPTPDGPAAPAPGPERLAELFTTATEAADALRPSRLPPTERPASAGQRDRALASAAGTARLMLGRALDLAFTDHREAVTGPAAAKLLRTVAGCVDATGAWLRAEGPLPDTTLVAAAITDFRVARMNTDPNGLPPDRLRLGALALSLGEWTKSLVFAVRLAAGEPPGHPDPTPPSAQPGLFWYAYRRTPALWWHRLRENLTPRSVAFQGALRLAAALAVARLIAGVLDLSHGFWVLLTILTVLRASAAETRSTLRPALIGTVAGSIVAALLLLLGLDPIVYVIALPVVMIAGFAAGPLLGLGWSQALFTLVITLVFAQFTPVDWTLAEQRVADVLLGAAIGVLIGLFAWPRGGAGELRRAAGTFLAASAAVVRETVAVMADGHEPGDAMPKARRAGQLAEASYALYQSERHPSATLDWQATLIAGHHAVRGSEALIKSCPAGGLLPCVTQLTTLAASVATCYDRSAGALMRGETPPRPPVPPATEWPDDLGQDLYIVADLRVWLDGLREDLTNITGRPEPADDLRTRVAQVADGAT
ncbi:FUSC family protein [Actinoplanes bogorensis]|uniref:FUSC family protein n=1 Tax=Paractinoplanes bogorensis TaxID=1610840 RepID=A0ABS5YYG7_9ACTN|nr:FUSC family protein [Actinoplanes bogorensis]MBU2668486.1 FUSC family protein [Actinoplanes bogorensis]